MTTQHYTGSCQCGAVAYEVDADLTTTVTCDCSRCRRMGFVLTFAPASAFTLLRGEEALTEFLFNRHAIRHLFCRTCGVESFARGRMPDGTETVAINANCLDGVDPRALPSRHVHGAAF
jgi:hypothetical protein